MKFVIDFGMTIYMFVLGLEMDASSLIRIPKREAIVAYAGMVFTFILTIVFSPLLHYGVSTNLRFYFAFSIIMSSTGSPLLTRVLTDLKIGKSNIGKFAISAAVYTELITILISCIGYAIFQPEGGFLFRGQQIGSGHSAILVSATLLAQTIITIVTGPIVLRWVNDANPHGKTIKGSHMILSVAYSVCVGCISPLMGFSPVLSAFVTGAFLPRQGRISQFVVTKVNNFLAIVFYPYFFVWVGLEARIGQFKVLEDQAWLRLLGFFAVEMVAKILGSLFSGLIFDFHWPESTKLALLLNVKGHLHIYLTIIAMKNQLITYSTCISMILAILFKIIYIPIIARQIIRRGRKRFPNQPLALQWHDPDKELRILIGFHGPENVPCAINFMEISKESGDPGMVVYATDMIQLTDEIAATLVSGGIDMVEVTDETVIKNRDKITTSLHEYIQDSEDDITLQRAMALATFNNMHQEIINLAEDSFITLIILPFHIGLPNVNNTHSGNDAFRYVNRKVLRNAPCSVAVMVDRGLGGVKKLISKSSNNTLNVVVIFIGGKDDREALAYAGRVAYHGRVKLTIIRFLVATDIENNSTRRTSQQIEEMKLDDECFANFYDKFIAGGKVSYQEKHLVNSTQAYSILRSLEGLYQLFIVGRGGRANTMLTVGMNDWEHCPELGPLGDLLSCPAFSTNASVLIIQQHDPKFEHGGYEIEFPAL
ncbi:cation/H(+) antiporter 28 isoform X2 [Spinacia oleracea]|nr:cation/H(+) antiporter 28-like isoform X2 [Spinacia oleracea]